MVVDANGFDAFLGLLLSSDRILPVVVLTEIPAIHDTPLMHLSSQWIFRDWLMCSVWIAKALSI